MQHEGRSRTDRQPRRGHLARDSPVNLGDSELVAIIEDIQDELPCYGYRRVTHELHRRGHLVNHKRVARVMRANGLGIKPRKRYVRTTDSNHNSPIYPNLYRNVIPPRPDMVWVADFTYIRLSAGFCYLAVILDACSRKVVGYGLSKRLDTPLALAALHSALENRKPPPGCIHHTDRGCQGRFNRSLQHPKHGGVYCDGKTEIRAVNAAEIILARATTGVAA